MNGLNYPDFFNVVRRRRSIRKFTSEPIDGAVVERALKAAVWAPNSSNSQTWDFYWVQEPTKKALLVKACLSQVAARSASELIVITANPRKWRRSNQQLIDWTEREHAPPIVKKYYSKLVPFVYRWGWFNSLGLLKWIVSRVMGLFMPVIRNQCFRSDLECVAIKSAALAAENLVLAIAAQDHDSCMMEGFDEARVRKVLGLGRFDRVVMVVAIGKALGNGTWNSPFRIPNSEVIHRV